MTIEVKSEKERVRKRGANKVFIRRRKAQPRSKKSLSLAAGAANDPETRLSRCHT
jgi:hypothetical protein